MRFLLKLSFCFAFFSLIIFSQNQVVLPDKNYATHWGKYITAFPFGSGPTRYQQIFSGKDMPKKPTLFKFISFRCCGFYSDSNNNYDLDLEIYLGETNFSYNFPSPYFAKNNPNPIKVVNRKKLILPIFYVPNPPPTFWSFIIPFDKPYTWMGKNNLCLEILIFNKPNYMFMFDGVTSHSKYGARTSIIVGRTPYSKTGYIFKNNGLVVKLSLFEGLKGHMAYFGKSCFNVSLSLPDYSTYAIGGIIHIMMSGGDPLSKAFLFIGNSDKKWGPYCLPLDLTPFGAKYCKLYTNPMLVIGEKTNSLGEANFFLPIPYKNYLIGTNFYIQWACIKNKKNPLNLGFSNAAKILIGKYYLKEK